TPAGFDRQFVLLRDPVIVDVLGNAADTVAAHLAFAAVGIEHLHPRIGPFRRTNQDQPVTPDSEVPIAHLTSQPGNVFRQFLFERIDIHVVVPGPVHLREAHLDSPRVQRTGSFYRAGERTARWGLRDR